MDELYRLYRKEWVIVYTVEGQGETAEPFVNSAHHYYQSHYSEQFTYPEQARIDAHTNNAGSFWVHLLLNKHNMKGEFKQVFLATNLAERRGWRDYEVVGRNSHRDHQLRNLGRKP